MVYKVTLNLDVVVDDEDFPFEKNCELIKDDIEQEISCCWNSIDITRMHFEAPPDHKGGYIRIPKYELLAKDEDLFP